MNGKKAKFLRKQAEIFSKVGMNPVVYEDKQLSDKILFYPDGSRIQVKRFIRKLVPGCFRYSYQKLKSI